MLSVYEYEAHSYRSPRRLIISYERGQFQLDREGDVERGLGWIVPLKLVAWGHLGEKTILELWLSTHQLQRIASYLRMRTWRGGFTMCPKRSEPHCTIHALSLMSDCDDWGLCFSIPGREPIEVAWVPSEGDREEAAKSLGELVNLAYSIREDVPPEEKSQDLRPWKQHLFGKEGD